MREAPADLERKDEAYVRVGSQLLAKYNIPPALVIGSDETNTLFVSRANKTRARKGAKKVRLLGVGADKAQITNTPSITEAGDVLAVQYIFGGTTNRCHPKELPPIGSGFFCHTKSHWQTPETMIELMDKVIIPYKTRKIEELGLPAEQWTMWKLDLHYSHKDKKVVAYAEANNICLLYVGAGCTDVRQECDTVLNKTYKCGVKAAFRDHLYKLFNNHLATNNGDAVGFHPVLTMGALKPHMVEFVETGMQACRTPAFKQTIIKAFAEDGLFAIMRSPERQASARAELAVLGDAPLVAHIPEGEEAEDELRVFALDEMANEIDAFLNDEEDGDSAGEHDSE
jgi:hypothetical protein